MNFTKNYTLLYLLQVSRLEWAFILLALASYLRKPLHHWSSWCYIYVLFYYHTLFTLPFSELWLVGLALDLVDLVDLVD